VVDEKKKSIGKLIHKKNKDGDTWICHIVEAT